MYWNDRESPLLAMLEHEATCMPTYHYPFTICHSIPNPSSWETSPTRLGRGIGMDGEHCSRSHPAAPVNIEGFRLSVLETFTCCIDQRGKDRARSTDRRDNRRDASCINVYMYIQREQKAENTREDDEQKIKRRKNQSAQQLKSATGATSGKTNVTRTCI